MLNMNLQDTQLDRASNLHLLYQVGAHASCYTVMNPAGELIKRETLRIYHAPAFEV